MKNYKIEISYNHNETFKKGNQGKQIKNLDNTNIPIYTNRKQIKCFKSLEAK